LLRFSLIVAIRPLRSPFSSVSICCDYFFPPFFFFHPLPTRVPLRLDLFPFFLLSSLSDHVETCFSHGFFFFSTSPFLFFSLFFTSHLRLRVGTAFFSPLKTIFFLLCRSSHRRLLSSLPPFPFPSQRLDSVSLVLILFLPESTLLLPVDLSVLPLFTSCLFVCVTQSSRFEVYEFSFWFRHFRFSFSFLPRSPPYLLYHVTSPVPIWSLTLWIRSQCPPPSIFFRPGFSFSFLSLDSCVLSLIFRSFSSVPWSTFFSQFRVETSFNPLWTPSRWAFFSLLRKLESFF